MVRTVTESDMRSLTPAMVKPFYKNMYWDKIKGDQLPVGIDYAAFDFAVNSGVSRAAKMLQQIAGVLVDGSLGPKSMEAIASCDPEQTVDALCDMRLDFMKRISTWPTFGKGWSARVARVKEKAISMTKAA
jgi:lysozyme family protein